MRPNDPQQIVSEKVMDIRGLESPLTRQKTEKALSSLSPGKILEVWCTDKAFIEETVSAGGMEENEYIGHIDDSEGYIRLYLIKA